MPPPHWALFPAIMFLEMMGEQLVEQAIPPPNSEVLFPVMMFSAMLGDEKSEQ